jgi:phosphoribosyl 1,2-cyclic phosphate phosphodiesterase
MARLVFTILGCASSGGVPRLGGHWGACDPAEPRNRRSRCSLLVQRFSETGETTVLIDSSPDLRTQLLRAGIGLLDAVVYTHEHADHVHGLDDLRMVVFNRKARLPVWANATTSASLTERFGYAFIQPEGSPYMPILDLHLINGPLTINGAGGPVTLTPFEVRHGMIDALGFRIRDLAYLPDVNQIPVSALPALRNLDCWILDALRPTPHPTHFSLPESLDWIDRMAPRRAVITNMHIDLDYRSVCTDTPDNVTAAYDGMKIEYQI